MYEGDLSVHSLRVTTSLHSWYAGGWGGGEVIHKAGEEDTD